MKFFFNVFASGGQGGSFRENRPVKHLDPPQKFFIKSCFNRYLSSVFCLLSVSLCNFVAKI
jgi:hypothetical protein